jgi:BirA family biotin operon repressor/biotin-[acetyl-CoA-carboxylase] ligase
MLALAVNGGWAVKELGGLEPGDEVQPAPLVTALGRPRLHHREIDSTNRRARELASAGAPHGTLVTAGAQTAGRGRQGRRWEAPAGSALLCSLVLREFDALLSLRAGLAGGGRGGRGRAREVAQRRAARRPQGRRRARGGRPHEGWAVVGIGVNVSAAPDCRGRGARRGTTSRRCWRSCCALEARLAEPKAAR